MQYGHGAQLADKNNKNITDLHNIKLHDRVSQSECLHSEKPAVKNRLVHSYIQQKKITVFTLPTDLSTAKKIKDDRKS